MERELLQRHLIKVVQTPVIKGDRLWWKVKTPKQSWCGWSYQVERRRSSRHRNWDGGLWQMYRNSLFIWSVAVISPIVHMVVENFKVTLKHLNCRRMWPPMKGKNTLERRCVGHDMSPRSDRPPMTIGEDTSEVWGPQYEPKFKLPHDDELRHLR